jgi:hypothetical protein
MPANKKNQSAKKGPAKKAPAKPVAKKPAPPVKKAVPAKPVAPARGTMKPEAMDSGEEE